MPTPDLRTHRPRSRPRAAAALLAAGVLLTTACHGPDPNPAPDAPTSPAGARSTTTGTPPETPETPGPPPTEQQGTPMDIRITGAGVELRGTLNDTAAARDFAALLPVTLTLRDYAGTEKIADLPRRLDTSGAPAAHAGRPGDITYYAPWGNLALFHGTGPHTAGLVPLGRLAAGSADQLADLHAEVTLTLDSPPTPR